MDINLAIDPAATSTIHQSLLELAPDGMVIVDAQGQVVLVNAQTETLFGYARTELINQSIEMLMPARFRTQHLKHRHAYQTNASARPMGLGMELYGLHKSGREFPIAISLNSIDTALGRMVFAAIRDVSSYRNAEQQIRTLNQELERQNKQLDSVNQELEAFAYSISHDLRAPLRSIVGFGEILREEHAQHLDTEGLRLLGIIRDSATKMGRLIDELLAFSRINRRVLEFRSVNMTSLAHEAFTEAMAGENKTRQVELKLDTLPEIRGSISMLKQVWINLISNAVKYSRPQEHAVVTIDACVHQREIWYTITDNGVGFDMQYAHKLFGVFERLHADTEFEGTGVGLALVQRIVSRHDGRIWADSTPGQGSTFTFALPVEPPHDE